MFCLFSFLRRSWEDYQARDQVLGEQVRAIWVRRPGYLNLKVYRRASRKEWA